ncbi:hypothetical protein VTL71DRAFT_5662 [Oculimacula yallundae]|uniref:DUF7587 domain-containing protein n=1 Tax=Oculimacula yallundae TaxID=86028 RepID=A0ABR4BY59_9HELO
MDSNLSLGDSRRALKAAKVPIRNWDDLDRVQMNYSDSSSEISFYEYADDQILHGNSGNKSRDAVEFSRAMHTGRITEIDESDDELAESKDSKTIRKAVQGDESAHENQYDSESDVNSILDAMARSDTDSIISEVKDGDEVEEEDIGGGILRDLIEFRGERLKRLRGGSDANDDDDDEVEVDVNPFDCSEDGFIRSVKRRRLSNSSDSGSFNSEATIPRFKSTSSTPSEADSTASAASLANPTRRELLSNKQHRAVVTMLKLTLRSAQPSLSQDKLEECLEMVDILEEKYLKATEKVVRKATKGGKHPESAAEHNQRLQGDEEKKHRWAPTKADRSGKSEIPGLLMRAWDEMSKGQVRDQRVGFLSGSSTNRLNTADQRKRAISQHSDWGNRIPTPFISFSSSLAEIGKIRVPWFQNRQKRKGILENTKLTIINARARLAAGKPILRMKTELLHYKVTTKYGEPRFEAGSYYENEFLCPFTTLMLGIVMSVFLLGRNMRGSDLEGSQSSVSQVAFAVGSEVESLERLARRYERFKVKHIFAEDQTFMELRK